MVKKILKSFTFWFFIISLSMIYSHFNGQDPKSIVLIYFNPILLRVSRIEFSREFMNSGSKISCETISGSISIYWYIAHMISAIIYGAILDTIRWILIKMNGNKIKAE